MEMINILKILKNNFPKNFSLKGMKIVIDCANGAGYKSAPKILSDLRCKSFFNWCKT
jgi:phosphoglucosamine mutase